MNHSDVKEVRFMATKSISKSVRIRNKKAGQMLFNAIESSYNDSNKAVLLESVPQRVEKKDIKEFFRTTEK